MNPFKSILVGVLLLFYLSLTDTVEAHPAFKVIPPYNPDPNFGEYIVQIYEGAHQRLGGDLVELIKYDIREALGPTKGAMHARNFDRYARARTDPPAKAFSEYYLYHIPDDNLRGRMRRWIDARVEE